MPNKRINRQKVQGETIVTSKKKGKCGIGMLQRMKNGKENTS